MALKRKTIHAVQSSLQMAIVHMFHVFKDDPEEATKFSGDTERIVRISKLTGISFTCVEKYIKKAQRGEKLVTPAKKKKRSSPITNIDNFSKEAIARFICEKLQTGYALTVKDVWNHVKENPDIFLFTGGLSSMWKIVKEIGFEWKKGDQNHYIKLSETILFKKSCFLREYVKNMNSSNPLPVVFLDETWIFINGKAPAKSWCKPEEKKAVIRRPAEGKRLVVVHAGSKQGFVPNADLLFVTNLKTGEDYHGAMDSANFEKWVTEKLIVGLRSLGSCLVVFDNASYHSRLLEKRPTTKWRKDQLLTWLHQNGVFPPPNVKKDELQRLCHRHKSHLKRFITSNTFHHFTLKHQIHLAISRQHLMFNISTFQSRERFVVDDLLMKEGHKVLRLPPYHCEFNTIEMVWGLSKRFYDKVIVSKCGQGFERSKNVWKEALETVTPDVWKNCVMKTEQIILDAYNAEVEGTPEVEEFIIIEHEESEDEDDYDWIDDCNDDDQLAVPLSHDISVSGAPGVPGQSQ